MPPKRPSYKESDEEKSSPPGVSPIKQLRLRDSPPETEDDSDEFDYTDDEAGHSATNQYCEDKKAERTSDESEEFWCKEGTSNADLKQKRIRHSSSICSTDSSNGEPEGSLLKKRVRKTSDESAAGFRKVARTKGSSEEEDEKELQTEDGTDSSNEEPEGSLLLKSVRRTSDESDLGVSKVAGATGSSEGRDEKELQSREGTDSSNGKEEGIQLQKKESTSDESTLGVPKPAEANGSTEEREVKELQSANGTDSSNGKADESALGDSKVAGANGSSEVEDEKELQSADGTDSSNGKANESALGVSKVAGANGSSEGRDEKELQSGEGTDSTTSDERTSDESAMGVHKAAEATGSSEGRDKTELQPAEGTDSSNGKAESHLLLKREMTSDESALGVHKAAGANGSTKGREDKELQSREGTDSSNGKVEGSLLQMRESTSDESALRVSKVAGANGSSEVEDKKELQSGEGTDSSNEEPEGSLLLKIVRRTSDESALRVSKVAGANGSSEVEDEKELQSEDGTDSSYEEEVKVRNYIIESTVDHFFPYTARYINRGDQEILRHGRVTSPSTSQTSRSDIGIGKSTEMTGNEPQPSNASEGKSILESASLIEDPSLVSEDLVTPDDTTSQSGSSEVSRLEENSSPKGSEEASRSSADSPQNFSEDLEEHERSKSPAGDDPNSPNTDILADLSADASLPAGQQNHTSSNPPLITSELCGSNLISIKHKTTNQSNLIAVPAIDHVSSSEGTESSESNESSEENKPKVPNPLYEGIKPCSSSLFSPENVLRINPSSSPPSPRLVDIIFNNPYGWIYCRDSEDSNGSHAVEDENLPENDPYALFGDPLDPSPIASPQPPNVEELPVSEPEKRKVVYRDSVEEYVQEESPDHEASDQSEGFKSPDHVASDRSEGFKSLDHEASDKSEESKSPYHEVSDRSEGFKSPDHGASDRSEGSKSPDHEASDRSEGSKSLEHEASDRSEGSKSLDHEASDRSEGSKSPDHEATDRSEASKSPDRETSDRSKGSKSPDYEASNESEGSKSPDYEASDESEGSKSPDHEASGRSEGSKSQDSESYSSKREGSETESSDSRSEGSFYPGLYHSGSSISPSGGSNSPEAEAMVYDDISSASITSSDDSFGRDPRVPVLHPNAQALADRVSNLLIQGRGLRLHHYQRGPGPTFLEEPRDWRNEVDSDDPSPPPTPPPRTPPLPDPEPYFLIRGDGTIPEEPFLEVADIESGEEPVEDLMPYDAEIIQNVTVPMADPDNRGILVPYVYPGRRRIFVHFDSITLRNYAFVTINAQMCERYFRILRLTNDWAARTVDFCGTFRPDLDRFAAAYMQMKDRGAPNLVQAGYHLQQLASLLTDMDMIVQRNRYACDYAETYAGWIREMYRDYIFTNRNIELDNPFPERFEELLIHLDRGVDQIVNEYPNLVRMFIFTKEMCEGLFFGEHVM